VLDLRTLTGLANGNDRNAAVSVEALAGGRVDLRGVGQVLDAAGPTFNDGVVALTADGAGSVIDLSALANFSSTGANRSTLTARNGGVVRVSAATLLLGIVADVRSGGTFVGSLEVGAGSVLQGHDGTLAGNVVNRGLVRPGPSVGTFTITGDYTQTVAGLLSLEIGGRTAGVAYDRLTVGGSVTLDGTLELLLVSGFSPVVGDAFAVLPYTSSAGTFGLVLGQAIGSDRAFSLDYGLDGLTLEVIAG
jgi:hypothetical protein